MARHPQGPRRERQRLARNCGAWRRLDGANRARASEEITDGVRQLTEIGVLDKVSVGGPGQEVVLVAVVATVDDDRHAPVHVKEAADKMEAVHGGRPDLEEDEVHPVRGHLGKCVSGILRRKRGVALVQELLFEQEPLILVGFDDKNGGDRCPPSSPFVRRETPLARPAAAIREEDSGWIRPGERPAEPLRGVLLL